MRALVLGAGPTRFGVGNELDHARLEAVAALRARGAHVAVLDANPALAALGEAHARYLEPLDARSLTRVVARERIDTLVPAFGGASAHALAFELAAARPELAVLGTGARSAAALPANSASVPHAPEHARMRCVIELLLEPNRDPIVLAFATLFEDAPVHAADAVAAFGALGHDDVRAAAIRHAADLADRMELNRGVLAVDVVVDLQTRAVHAHACEPWTTRFGAAMAHVTGLPWAARIVRVLAGESLEAHERETPELTGVLVRWPRFAFDTFTRASTRLDARAASLGAAYALGSNLTGALQSAARAAGHDALPGRLGDLADALRQGRTEAALAQEAKLPSAVVEALADLVRHESLALGSSAFRATRDASGWRALKDRGFSDARIAALSGRAESDVRAAREACGVTMPTFVQATRDSDSVRFPTWPAGAHVAPASDASTAGDSNGANATNVALVVGSGPLRVGHGAYADATAVSALHAIRDASHTPVVASPCAEGPLLAATVAAARYLCGTSREDIDAVVAQYTHRVNVVTTYADGDVHDAARIVDTTHAPEAAAATSAQDALAHAERIGYPVLLRVRARGQAPWSTVVNAPIALRSALDAHAAPHATLRVERFVSGTELDVLLVADGTQAFVVASAEQVEPTGVHEADSAKVIPPHALPETVVREAEERARALSRGHRGLLTVRFAHDGQDTWTLHVSPRATSLVALASVLVGHDVARVGMRCTLGASLAEAGLAHEPPAPRRVAVRECVLPFYRLTDIDPSLRPDPQSVGEVAGVGTTVARAYAKALRATGLDLHVPREEPRRTALLATAARDASGAADVGRRLHALGFDLAATESAAGMLASMRIPHRLVALDVGRDVTLGVGVALVTAQTPDERAATERLRHACRAAKIPCFTTMPLARAACAALEEEDLALEVTTLER